MFGFLKRKQIAPRSPELNPRDPENVAISRHVVGQFADVFVQLEPHEIRDASTLPYPKKVILNCFLIAIADESSAPRVANMMTVGLGLAQFRDGVGDTPLTMAPFVEDMAARPTLTDKDLQEFSNHQHAFERHQETMTHVLAERRELAALFDRANTPQRG